MRDLDDVARLLGDRDEHTSHRLPRRAEATAPPRSASAQVPVMPPAVLRTLPFGTGVLLLRHTRPAVIDLQPWPARPDAPSLIADRERIEEQTRASTCTRHPPARLSQ